MTDAADVARRSPFEGVAVADVVRDVVAAVALLVALPLPWDVLRRGSDLLWVVLATVLALLVIAAPYARRAGVLTGSWENLATGRARLVGLAPYGLVALVYLVLDAVRSVADAGGVGTGLALGLAGAMLAAALPGTRPLVVTSVVVAIGAVATPVVGAVDGAGWAATLSSTLAALLVVGLLWLTVKRFLDGDDAAGIVLMAVGAAVALELAMLGGAVQHVWLESLHGSRYGMLLIPVVAAAAVPPAMERRAAAAGEEPQVSALRWVRVAVQAFELVMLVAAFVGLNAVVQLVALATDDGGAVPFVELVLRIVVGVLTFVVALLSRRALERDPRSAHATAVGAACIVVVLGVIILVARAGVGTASRVEELLLALALPAIALGALLLPPSVRALAASRPEPVPDSAARPEQGRGEQGYGYQQFGEHQYGEQQYGEQGYGYQQFGEHQHGEQQYSQQQYSQQGAYQPQAEGRRRDDELAATQTQVTQAHAAAPGTAPAGAASASSATSQGARWRGTWAAGTDATQQLSPVTGDRAQEHVEQAGSAADARQGVDATQMLPPVQDVPGRWTADVALDPSTPLEDLATIVQEAPHLRPHVAANPSTYPALLDWLGALGDPGVDAALRTRR
ncbi:hypothetical protein ACNHYB_01070 [Isoptericola jiangsuensis]|uniref:DUF7937 domain-containing protein n=1 Tax=Isoptericola jiangsuensis TaxID=548579 RepID=UPI003AAC66DD